MNNSDIYDEIFEFDSQFTSEEEILEIIELIKIDKNEKFTKKNLPPIRGGC
jgi:hypothetical protein